MNNDNVKYAGFWIRFVAMIIDSILLTIIMYGPVILVAWLGLLEADTGLFTALYVFFMFILPALVVILFWKKYQSTPGKMIFNLKIVDADSFEKASTMRYFVRYIGYIISMIPLFLGYFWAGWDKKKKGFHDMLANTVVIYS